MFIKECAAVLDLSRIALAMARLTLNPEEVSICDSQASGKVEITILQPILNPGTADEVIAVLAQRPGSISGRPVGSL